MASKRGGYIDAHALAHPDLSFFGLAAPQVLVYGLQNAHTNFSSGRGVAISAALYLAISACLAAAVFMGVRRREPPPGLDWAVAGAAIPPVLLAAVPMDLPTALRLASAAGAGAALGWMYVRWAPFYARLSIGDAVACVFVSMASGSLVKLAGDLMPAAAHASLLALLPAASFALLRRASRLMPEAAERPLVFGDAGLLPLSGRILVGVVAYSLAIGASRGLAGPSSDPVNAFDVVQHFAEVALAGGVMWWVFGRSGTLRFARLWSVASVIAITGFALLPLLHGGSRSGMALAFVFCAQTITVMLLWLVLADVARHSARSPYLVFGLGWLAYSLPCAAGELLGMAARHAGAAETASLLLGYCLAVVSILVLNEESFEERRIFGDLEAPRVADGAASISAGAGGVAGAVVIGEAGEPPAPDAVTVLGERFGITAREAEVACLLARGRSKTYIAEALFVSENTVRSHAKRIYAKMGVHSRQELLDRFEDAGLG